MEYEPWDREEKLGEPPWDQNSYDVQAWEAAHGHDVRLKCYVEYGCQIAWKEQAREAGWASPDGLAQVRGFLEDTRDAVLRGADREEIARIIGNVIQKIT